MIDVPDIDLSSYRQIVIMTGAGISVASVVLLGRAELLLPRLLGDVDGVLPT